MPKPKWWRTGMKKKHKQTEASRRRQQLLRENTHQSKQKLSLWQIGMMKFLKILLLYHKLQSLDQLSKRQPNTWKNGTRKKKQKRPTHLQPLPSTADRQKKNQLNMLQNGTLKSNMEMPPQPQKLNQLKMRLLSMYQNGMRKKMMKAKSKMKRSKHVKKKYQPSMYQSGTRRAVAQSSRKLRHLMPKVMKRKPLLSTCQNGTSLWKRSPRRKVSQVNKKK
mmetsp:Transcript_33403/g.44074  ORF Transcript_33403/g.44074 Transcript_33403/m.44074 type:complete len:220 (+) Transcript_33403:639-1298(+)